MINEIVRARRFENVKEKDSLINSIYNFSCFISETSANTIANYSNITNDMSRNSKSLLNSKFSQKVKDIKKQFNKENAKKVKEKEYFSSPRYTKYNKDCNSGNYINALPFAISPKNDLVMLQNKINQFNKIITTKHKSIVDLHRDLLQLKFNIAFSYDRTQLGIKLANTIYTRTLKNVSKGDDYKRETDYLKNSIENIKREMLALSNNNLSLCNEMIQEDMAICKLNTTISTLSDEINLLKDNTVGIQDAKYRVSKMIFSIKDNLNKSSETD